MWLSSQDNLSFGFRFKNLRGMPRTPADGYDAGSMTSDLLRGQPTAVGPYDLIELIGEGDIGTVYTARKRGVSRFDKRLVVKRLRPELCEVAGFREAFVAEARLAASLSHTNIVQVVEIGEDGGMPFLVMEHVQGMDLAACNNAMRRQGVAWPAGLAAFVAAEVAMALDHAHRRRDLEGRPLGIVHQDIMPANVLLSYEGAVKITDFGMASASGQERLQRVAHPRYLAPEQVRGEAVDPRTDVYACGLLLLEMLAGRPPLAGVDSDLAAEQLGLGTVPLLGEDTRSRVEPSLLGVLSRATAPWPDDRYEGAAELYEELMATIFAAERKAGRRDLVDLLRKLREKAEATDVVPVQQIDLALGSWRRSEVPPAEPGDPEVIGSQDLSFERLASDVERLAVGSSQIVLENPDLAPMRGRTAEREAIAAAVARAARGERGVIEVVAPEGRGKTRLVLEVVGKARSGEAAADFHVVRCRDLPSIGRFTAARTLLQSILGLIDGDEQSRTAVIRKLRELGLSRYEREALQDVIGVGPGQAPPGPGRVRATGRGLARVLRRLAEDALTIVFFDDADLMDSDSARLLPRIVRDTEGSRLLVVLARRDEISPWPEPIGSEVITVPPLEPEHLTLLVCDVLLSSAATPAVIHRIERASEGNPRVACEVARLLSEIGTVVVTEGVARFADGEGLPRLSFDQVIQRRLELRTDIERAALEVAACIGDQFEIDVLTSTMNLASDATASVLASAVAARLIVVRSPTSCAFAHERVRTAVLGSLGREDLGAIHSRIAEAMAANTQRADASWRLRCANHLRLGGQRARARDLLATSASQLEATGATDAAIDHFSAAIELTKGQDEVPVALALALRTANLALRCGRLREGLRAAALAVDLAHTSHARGDEVGALVLAGRLEGASGRIEHASARFKTALEAAERAGDTEARRRIRGAMGELLVQTGDYRRAVTHLEVAIAEAPDAAESPRFLLLAALCRGRSGELDVARGMLARVARGNESARDPSLEVGVLLGKAALCTTSGEIEGAVAALQDCRDLARAHGLHHDNALASHYQGCALLRHDRPQRAFASLRYSFELSREHGFERLIRLNLVALLALDAIYHLQPQAIERMERALLEARDAGFLADVLQIRYHLGQALAALGRTDEAKGHLEQAHRAGRATGNIVFDAHIEQLLASLE